MPEEADRNTISSRLDEYLESDSVTEASGPELIFTTLVEFVEEYVSNIMRLPDDGAPLAWCPSWWAHPEAVVRLSTMWRSMEYLAGDPALGMSVWWRDHVDPHMRMLRDPLTGPFAACQRARTHVDQPTLPTDVPPDEMFDHPAYSLEAAQAAEAPTAEEIRNSPRPWLGWIALTMPQPDNGTNG
jgi:hypothetical protein